MSNTYKVGSTFRYTVYCRRPNATTGQPELFDPDPLIISIRSENGHEDATAYGGPTETGKSLTRDAVGVYTLSYVLQSSQLGSCEVGARGNWISGGASWPSSQERNYQFEVVPDPLSFTDITAL